MRKLKSNSISLIIFLGCAAAVNAQDLGTITGTVSDASGAVVPNAAVTITNKATGAARQTTANAGGLYAAPALDPGEYEVRVEVEGFRTVVSPATVQAGTTTTVNTALSVGATREVVNVEAAAAQIEYESNAIQGVVQRNTIQDLPLNGRSFLQLAQVEPGVVITVGSNGFGNQNWNVSIMGGASNHTYFTVDNVSIDDELAGGAAMNFSQEVVQEFQLSSVNFDLSTGITSVGAINIVSRSGSNDYHGSAYFFYRDHNMAAYPTLKRSTTEPNPFFERRAPGFWLSGPLIRNKLFFFYNYEFTTQTNAVSYQPDLPSIQDLGGVFPSPFVTETQTARVDYHLSDKHSMFARFSHDGNHSIGLFTTASPSAWTSNANQVDNAVIGVTSVLKPTIVNDLRLSWFFWHNRDNDIETVEPNFCQFPCVGGNLPPISSMIGSTNFVDGTSTNASEGYTQRRWELGDNVAWQKGSHRLKFGSDVTMQWTLNFWTFCTPLCTQVYSPETTKSTVTAAQLAQYFPNLPSVIASTADVLNLPVSNAAAALEVSGLSFGGDYWPGTYDHGPQGLSRRPRWFGQDTWKIRPNLTLNYGIAYEISGGLFNSDLKKPAFLAPIFGANNLGATQTNYNNISPAIGFAWSPFKDNKTVIRGGGGLYWDTNILNNRPPENGLIGPLGTGMHLAIGANVLTNTFPGIVEFLNGQVVPLPVGANLPISTLTNMTLGQFLQIYNQQFPALNQVFGSGAPQITSGPFTVSGIDVAKQGVELIPPQFPLTRSYQTSIGVQRELGYNTVLSVDYARRLFENVSMNALDYNHYSEFINGVRSPVIPLCSPANYTPGVECSNGAITVFTDEGRAVYNALLVKANKRFSNHIQAVASYAYQSNDSNATTAAGNYNLNNWRASYGDTIARHNLNVAGVVSLPWGVQLSVNSSFLSKAPTNALLSGIDLTGTSGQSNPIPGLPYNCLNDGCGKAQLTAAVASFNATYAGKVTPSGKTIPSLILPPDYQFNDPILSQDFRLTKFFTYKERCKLSVFAEMFNAFNISNLSGYSTALDTVNPNPAKQTFSFGQPTTRVVQTFGSGGPRAVQLGARFQF